MFVKVPFADLASKNVTLESFRKCRFAFSLCLHQKSSHFLFVKFPGSRMRYAFDRG